MAGMPPNPFNVEQGRQGLARVSMGVTTGTKSHLAESNRVMDSARKTLQASKTSTGQVSGVPTMRRQLQSSAPIPPQQPKVASLLVFSEFVKAASEAADRRRRHEYYVAHRNEILQKKRAYRQRNAAQIRRAQARYRRKVKMGTKKQRQRISTGGHSFMYGGYR